MPFLNKANYKKKVSELANVKDKPTGFEGIRVDSGNKIKCLGKHYNYLLEVFKNIKESDYNEMGYIESGTVLKLLEDVNPIFREAMEKWKASPNKVDLRNTSFYLSCFNEPAIFLQHFGHIHYWKTGRIEVSSNINNVKPKVKETTLEKWL